jgi:hypothetical protein
MPTLDPSTAAFWAEQLPLMGNVMADTLMRVLLAGMENGAAGLPRGYDLLIDWDVINHDALDWMRRYNFNLIGGITETTARQTIKIIEEWTYSGQPLAALEARLATVFGAARASRIAVTEVTRLYAEGNMAAWRSTGVVSGKMWYTRVNEGVCPICKPLHGQIVQLDGEFHHPNPAVQSKVRSGMKMTGKFTAPPAHVNCYCWLQPFVSEDLLREAIRSELRARPLMELYGVGRGDLVEAMLLEWRGTYQTWNSTSYFNQETS